MAFTRCFRFVVISFRIAVFASQLLVQVNVYPTVCTSSEMKSEMVAFHEGNGDISLALW